MQEQTRDRLIRAATDLIRNHGLDAVTLRAIGLEAGVSRAAPYRHFADKTDLLAAVAGMRMTKILQAIEAKTNVVTSPEDRLALGLTAYVEESLDQPILYTLIFSPDLSHNDDSSLRKSGEAAFGLLKSLVYAVVPEEEQPGVASSIWAALHGAIMLNIAGHNETEKGMTDTVAVVLNAAHLMTS